MAATVDRCSSHAGLLVGAAIVVGATACTADPDAPASPDADVVHDAAAAADAGPVTLVLDGLEPGWVVTVSDFVDQEPPVERAEISDGTPITLVGGPNHVFFAVVADADGNLIRTHTMRAPCTMAAARRLDVPAEYATIQAAVDAADPGDTVKVAPGTYGPVSLRPGICLLGSGARKTILDAAGAPVNLIDLTDAPGSVVSGFTVRNVAQATGCARPWDPFACSGDWYRAGLYAGGTDWDDPTQDAPPLIINNVFEDNDTGVFLYWRTVAEVRSNIFVGNRIGLVANHFQSRAFIANNVFVDNSELAIGNQAAYLDIVNNAIVGSDMAIRFQYIQTGYIRCNLFYGNGVVSNATRFAIGEDGNIEVEPGFVDAPGRDFHLRPDSAARNAGCFESSAFDYDGSPQDIGAYGGPLGAWSTL